jgi:transglutaminase-like putative cysteine protease
MAALWLLLALYVAGAANEPRTGWQVQGLVALLALYLWGWSSRTRRAEDGRAAGWLLGGAIVSVLAAGLLAGGPLVNVSAWQPFGEPGATTAFDWNQTYGPLPWSTSSAEMAQISSRGAHLWRATELDRFDGTGFLASGHPPAEPSGPAEELQSRWVTTATVTVHDLAGRDLLSPGQIISVTAQGVPQSELGHPAPDGTEAASAVLHGGARYTLTAYVPQPTARELREAPSSFPVADLPYAELELPGHRGLVAPGTAAGASLVEASPYRGVYALARRLAAGARGTYELAARIESYLRGGGFSYDTNPPPSPLPLVTFLLGNHLGYCQQFSAAMALLLRMDGVPARVGSGFLPGTRSPRGDYEVTGLDAHAWVEVLFEGIGWVPFDPTPPTRIIPLASHSGGSELSPGQLAAARRPKVKATGAGPSAAAARRAGAGVEAIWILLGGLVLLAAAGLLVRFVRGRSRVPLAGDGSAAVEELTRALRRLDREPPPGSTLAELERRLASSHGEQAAGYVRSLRALRYGSPGPAVAPSAAERRRLRRALTAGRGIRARIRGLILLPPRRRQAGGSQGELPGVLLDRRRVDVGRAPGRAAAAEAPRAGGVADDAPAVMGAQPGPRQPPRGRQQQQGAERVRQKAGDQQQQPADRAQRAVERSDAGRTALGDRQ